MESAWLHLEEGVSFVNIRDVRGTRTDLKGGHHHATSSARTRLDFGGDAPLFRV